MDLVVLTIFVLVYLGMLLGEIPGLAVDRTGVALLGALALVAFERVSLAEARDAIDVPTMALLFGLMVVSAQFRLGGFYAALTRTIARCAVSPPALLALLIATSGTLSALLANDIICLAMTPVLIEGCARRNLRPMPFLLALACASNVGSAATLIGNPQNMLIAQKLNLSFAGYLVDGGIPALLGLAATWAVIVRQVRGQWFAEQTPQAAQAPPFDAWQTTKGLLVLSGLTLAFLLGSWPRDVVALTAAGVVLASRKLHSRDKLGLVDWQLLVLFMGLFIVNHALAESGLFARGLAVLRGMGINLQHPAWLFFWTIPLSNLVSNVPAVMLLLPAATHPLAGPILALSSTLAGNLFLVGSIANIIVADQAAQFGVVVTWREHARTGVPVTLVTLAIAAGWMVLRAL